MSPLPLTCSCLPRRNEAFCPAFSMSSVPRSATGVCVRSSNADILVPEIGMRADEVGHYRDAPVLLNDVNSNSATSKPFLLAHECAVLSDHDRRNAVQRNRATAHRAR